MLTTTELRVMRVRWHVTQAEVARQAGCERQFVSAVEKGDRRMTAQLAAAYKVAIGRKRRSLRKLLAEKGKP